MFLYCVFVCVFFLCLVRSACSKLLPFLCAGHGCFSFRLLFLTIVLVVFYHCSFPLHFVFVFCHLGALPLLVLLSRKPASTHTHHTRACCHFVHATSANKFAASLVVMFHCILWVVLIHMVSIPHCSLIGSCDPLLTFCCSGTTSITASKPRRDWDLVPNGPHLRRLAGAFILTEIELLWLMHSTHLLREGYL